MMKLPLMASPSLSVLLWCLLLLSNSDDSASFGVSAFSALPTQQVFRHHFPLICQTKFGRAAVSSKSSADNPRSSRHLANRRHDAAADDDGDVASLTLPSSNFGDNENSSMNQHARKHQRFCYGRHTVPNLLFAACVALTINMIIMPTTLVAHAAPPIAIIAEELGYFPVTNTAGETIYVPKRVQRKSSQQAIELARRLQENGVAMAGTYWCPHTNRQRELFGKEAWDKIRYVECSPKGYNANAAFCIARQVDGYPTWLFPGGKQVSGERPLSVLAKEVGMTNFRDDLETNVPPLPGSACQ